MPKPIIDDLSGLPMSRQQRYQIRKRRDRKCIRCGKQVTNEGCFCEAHRQANNVSARELQRRRFDLKHRYHESESYGFSCSTGRQLFAAAKVYLEEARRESSPSKASAQLRVALVIGFSALEAYLKTVAEEFHVRVNQTSVPVASRIEYLFKKLSSEPLNQASTDWQEFKLALKLREALERPRKRFEVATTERALRSIWNLINRLNKDIHGTRWT